MCVFGKEVLLLQDLVYHEDTTYDSNLCVFVWGLAKMLGVDVCRICECFFWGGRELMMLGWGPGGSD